MNHVTTSEDPRDVCLCAFACCHVKCIHRRVTLRCLCGRHLEDFPFIICQSEIHNSGRTKRGARLASDKIYVETVNISAAGFKWTTPPSASLCGTCLCDACGSVGDVSDLGPCGELLFQGRQFIKVSDKCRDRKLEFTFQPRGWRLHVASTPKLPTFFYLLREWCYNAKVLIRKI